VRLFGITRAGLATIAACVIALWSCIALEAMANVRAATDANASRQAIERLRRQSVPASVPEPPFRPPIAKYS